jgi:chromosome segregation ATPase
MTASPGPSRRKRSALAPAAELLIESGPLKGTRRALDIPLTCLGRGPACDLRLDADGVSPLHCAIAHGPGGFLVRDLGSAAGTQVNGEKIDSASLHDGDLLTLGSVVLRAHLPRLGPAPAPLGVRPAPADLDAARAKEALRIQVAAVVAQQAALTEEEQRLRQRREGIKQQEAQLAEHLEAKRRKLVELNGQVQAGRAALKEDRETYERQVEQISGDLTAAQRDLLEKRQQIEAERSRALALRGRLRDRYRRLLRAGQAELQRRQRELDALSHSLEKGGERMHQERAALSQAVLRFNGEVELRRRQMRAEWDRLGQEKRTWREQQEREAGELDAWQADLERRETELEEAWQAHRQERASWYAARQGLEKESAGLESRARNQRRKVAEQQQEIERLGSIVRDLRKQADPPGDAAGPGSSTALVPAVPAGPPAGAEASWGQRVAALEVLAGELADQRLQLAEQWEQLARAREAWQAEQRTTSCEIKALAGRLHDQGQAFLTRESQLADSTAELCRQHQELTQLRQHLVGWQARLRARELAWEADRDRLLAELRGREELAERHLAALVDLRQRWSKRRRRELEVVRAERAACEKARQQFSGLRDERRRRLRELEEERRELAARALALEQYRQKCLSKVADRAAAEQRVERLRRRWLAENAATLRALQRERTALEAEAAQLEERQRELGRRADELHADRTAAAERQTAWEQRQLQFEADQGHLRLELRNLEDQRNRARQEADDLRQEVERIARQLLDEPEAPPLPLLEKAA